MIIKWIVCAFFFVGALGANEESTIASKVYIPELNVTQLTLKNGMKVCLKPTEFETEEILLRVIAPGGFASLPPTQRASGELAAQIAWESGLGPYTSDQLSVLLYEHILEFNARIEAFSRVIDGSSSGSDGLETLLSLVKMYFMQKNFSEEAFTTVMRQTKEGLTKRSADRDTTYEDAYRSLNTQNFPYLNPLNAQDIASADFTTAKDFFEYAFANPADFTCVIVGNFNKEEDLQKIVDSLNSIPQRNPKTTFSNPQLPTFPKGEIKQKVAISGRTDSLVRLTFPLPTTLDASQLYPFEVAIQVLESRLRDTLREKMNTSQGISVAYEMPLYPLLEMTWIIIQYRAEPKNVTKVEQIIFEELKKLRDAGPTQAELDKVLQNYKRADEFWLKDNTYWLETMSNYYIWGWNPQGAIKTFDNVAQLTPNQIKDLLIKFVSIGNYTLLYSVQ